jgi:hypothetical protein
MVENTYGKKSPGKKELNQGHREPLPLYFDWNLERVVARW